VPGVHEDAQVREGEGGGMKKKHEHSATGNTTDAFETFIGCKVVGFLRNAHGLKIFVFDCGYGFAINSNGAYWVEGPEEIKRLQEALKRELRSAGIRP
jgi:hypothetical protein